MQRMTKKYKIQATTDDGRQQNIFAFDEATAISYARKLKGFRRVQVFAVYTRKRNDTYMDNIEYSTLVEEV